MYLLSEYPSMTMM